MGEKKKLNIIDENSNVQGRIKLLIEFIDHILSNNKEIKVIDTISKKDPFYNLFISLKQLQNKSNKIFKEKEDNRRELININNQLKEEIENHIDTTSQLFESQVKFRSVFEESINLFSLLSPDGKIIEFNKTAKYLFSKKDSEFTNKLFWKLPWNPTNASMRDQLKDVIKEAKRGKLTQIDLDIKNYEGKHLVFDITIKPIFDETDDVVFLLVEGRDVTVRKEIELSLLESKGKLRTLLESSAAGIQMIGPDGLLYCNAKLEQITGFTREELLEMDPFSIIHPDFLDDVKKKSFFKKKSGDKEYQNEIKIIRKGGEERWAELTNTLIKVKNIPTAIISVYDITERKNAEVALKESEEKFRALADASPAVIFIHRGGKFLYCNNATLKIGGYTRKELEQHNIIDVVHPDHKEMVIKYAIARLQGKKAPTSYELKILTKKNKVKWLEISAELFVLDGQPTVIGTGFDITKRKKWEKELKEAHNTLEKRVEERTVELNKFKFMVDGSAEEIFLVDQTGKMAYVNAAAAKNLGYKKKELLKKHVWDIDPVVPFEKFNGIFKELLKRKNLTFETIHLKKNGKPLPKEIRATLIDIYEQPFACVFSHDITEQKQHLKDLQDSEEKFRSYINQALDGVVVFDNKGIIIEMNPAMGWLVGIDNESSIGKSIEQFFSKEKSHLKKGRAYLRKLYKTGELRREIYFVDTFSNEKIVEMSSVALDETTFIGFVRDVTQHKIYESEIKASEIMQRNLNRFNRLRAKLWKLAANKNIKEKTLIDKLLSTVGPELGVSRACYNRFMNEDLVCVQEWCAEGISPSIGSKIPRIIAKHHLKNIYQIISKEIMLEKIPSALKPIANSLLMPFANGLNLESTLAAPYYIKGEMEGSITFDVCKSDFSKDFWNKERMKLVPEVIQIITQAIAQKRMESELFESERKYRTIIETATESIAAYDYEGNVLFLNSVARKILDMKKNKGDGLTIWDLFTKEAADEHIVRVKNIIDSGKPQSSIITQEKTAQGLRWFNTSIAPITDAHGNSTSALIIAADITERRKTQEQLNKFSSAVKVSPDSIFVTDLNGIILDVNEGTLKLHKTTSRNYFIGRNAYELIAPEYREKAHEDMQTALNKGSIHGREYVVLTKKGDKVPVEISISTVYDQKGNPTGFVAVSRNITERKKYDEKIKNYQKLLKKRSLNLESKVKQRTKQLELAMDDLKRLDEIKSHFASVMSHELKTPLTTVYGTLDILLEEMLGPLTKDQKTHLEKALLKTKRLTEIIDNILLLTKIQSHHSEIILEEVKLCDVIISLVIAGFNESEQNRLKIPGPHETLCVVIGHNKLLEIVFRNLIDNALKFSPEDSFVELKMHETEKTITIEILDQGKGIDESQSDKIFEMFYQEDNSLTRSKPGSGLGLALVKVIMNVVKGSIWVESEKGKGSRFFVNLLKPDYYKRLMSDKDE